MSNRLRIFLASSKEASKYAHYIESLIYDQGGSGVSVQPWYAPNSFPPGKTFIHSLIEIMRTTEAGIFVVTPDDKVMSRGNQEFAPRDNVILECGMSIAAHTLERTALAIIGPPHQPSGNKPESEHSRIVDARTLSELKLPSDLTGVNHIALDPAESSEEFNGRNRSRIAMLIAEWRKLKLQGDHQVNTILPKLYETINRVISRFQETTPPADLDHIAAALLDALGKHFAHAAKDNGISNLVCDKSVEFLANANSIWALDVLGPAAWLTPNAFRYLAIQIRSYFGSNGAKFKQPFKLSQRVAKAIRGAVANMQKHSGHESITKFDDRFWRPRGTDGVFQWCEDEPSVEFVRILIWTEEELRDPIAQCVMAIHEAFHVPLFALLASPDARDREFDFILFRQTDDELVGFWNGRKQGFVPQKISGGVITEHGKCLDHWDRLFGHRDLMFAADVRHLLVEDKVALGPALRISASGGDSPRSE